MKIIGQNKLLEKLNAFTIDTFPRSALFVGEKGCGKHTIVNYIKDNIVQLPLMDITDMISYEFIEQIYQNPNPCIYLIDMSNSTEITQNSILKFLEEPLNNSFICLLAESKLNLLPTVVNRCIVFEFEPYTKKELMSFITVEANSDLVISILKTPGKIIGNYIKDLPGILELCHKIVTQLNRASFPNTLSIVDKINFKDAYNKYDLDVFLDCLCNELFNDYLKFNANLSLKLYDVVKLTKERLYDKRLNKEQLFENMLTVMWKMVQ